LDFIKYQGDQLFNQFFETTDIHLGKVFILNLVVGHGDWSVELNETDKAEEVCCGCAVAPRFKAFAAVGLHHL